MFSSRPLWCYAMIEKEYIKLKGIATNELDFLLYCRHNTARICLCTYSVDSVFTTVDRINDSSLNKIFMTL
jgi:hypothetical protein